jgi:hypothetical protein
MTDASSTALPFSTRQLERVFARLSGRPPLHVHDVLSGNINTIVRVECDGRLYGLRIRTQEQVYRYEPDLVKEAFVTELLKPPARPRTDTAIARLFDTLLNARCGRLDSAATVLPPMQYYDWTRQVLAYPYCVYEWVDGAPLWDTPGAALYRAAGQALAQIHTVRFEAWYADFPSVGKEPLGWSERFPSALTKEIDAARRRLPSALAEAAAKLRLPDTLDVTACLIHNDFSPGNILVADGRLTAIIDWDNAVVDAPALDFVKMKYWTAKDAGGQLAPQSGLFGAFLDGYGPAGRDIVESLSFALYEMLWLLRVFNFECAKQEQGIAQTPGYPEAGVYEAFLSEVLTRLTRF